MPLILEVSLTDGVSPTLLGSVAETMGVVGVAVEGVATLIATELVLTSVSVLECSLCLVKPIGLVINADKQQTWDNKLT